MATYEASPYPPLADVDLTAWIGALRWVSLALLTGIALAAVFAGVSSDGVPVQLFAVLVAVWAVVATVPVHTVLGVLQRGVAERGETRQGTESVTDLDAFLAPVIPLRIYSRVS